MGMNADSTREGETGRRDGENAEKGGDEDDAEVIGS